ncbi:MAG: hypothetical protein A3F73_06450 [Gallionellales bacterium RIFCSPLOWO2_12_FULL_59_22]|nr:MAG: hypothetical protein A3H99_11335 [Gallionellales bacterium RIFCSPLOWO2_02_FULL_59_110]OGT02063.1 MAG: hypothetical protein A2Z65_09985 [Gallionellales bacterium RIFCSPLOWO2_02_58_13]OGT13440.1 MAG: hypothetical protein A3F73_06450 [Gallionellales bacterium RIFCSPLOWO2_12_FULL_59_22]
MAAPDSCRFVGQNSGQYRWGAVGSKRRFGNMLDRGVLLHDGALDVLAYAPGGVGGETDAALRLESFYRLDETMIAFPDQFERCQAAIGIVFGKINYQMYVVGDHFSSRVGIVISDKPDKFLLLLGGQLIRS